MAGEAAPGGPAPTPTPRVTLLFRVPYMTQWGQNLVVVGAGERLGEWEARAGPWMGCSFEGETLVWTVILSVPWTPAIEYKYAVVDEQVEVVRQESQPRRVTLPGGEGVRAGGLVVLRDTWRDPSSPQHILKSAAFARVILRKEDLLDAGAWQSPEQNLAGRLRALEVLAAYATQVGHIVAGKAIACKLRCCADVSSCVLCSGGSMCGDLHSIP